MKTKLFKEAYFSDNVEKNIVKISSFDKKSVQIMINWFRELRVYPRFDSNEIELLAKRTNESAKVVITTVKTIHTLLCSLCETDDNIDDLIDDVKELGVFTDKGGFQSFSWMMSELWDVKINYSVFRKIRQAERLGLNTLSGGSMSVAIKPVFKKRFEYGIDDILNYEPEILSYAPVVMIQLSKNDNDKYEFQMNSDNFDRFLSDLISVQAELKQVENNLNQLNSLK